MVEVHRSKFFANPTGAATSRRASVVLALLALGLIGLVGRLVQINTSERSRFVAWAEQQRKGSSVLPARRGLIQDRRGRVVAASRQSPDVFVDPSRIQDVKAVSGDLAARLNLAADEVTRRIERRKDAQYVVIASHVDEVEADAIREWNHSAVGLYDREIRTYPLGESMSHVLGLVGRDGIGLEGVEKQYDSFLRGVSGRRATVMDARRRPLWHAEGGTLEPQDGGGVVLTLDAEIQRIAESELDEALAEFEAKSGAVLVMSSNDGAVLALANRPAFDPNFGSLAAAELRRNRVLTDPVEPGSCLKPFIACGALDGGYLRATDQIDCELGTWTLGGRVVRDTSPHGMMDIAGIMTYSSNIGMVKIGQRMGNAALHQTVNRWGLGMKTGIDLPGEDAGLVRPLKRWGSMSAASISMGYEVNVTPIQMAAAFSSLVNGGYEVNPHVLLERTDSSGVVVAEPPSLSARRRVMPEAICKYVGHELLLSAIESEGGTGRRARSESYRIVGKTGTPKLLNARRTKYEEGAYQPVFVGAAPASKPLITVLVMVHRPRAKLGYYGGLVAAPAARDIIEQVLQYLGEPPDKHTVLTQR